VKNRTWIVIIGVLLTVCVGLSCFLLWPRQQAAYAEIWSEGELVHKVDLSQDTQITVETSSGINVVQVAGGKIAVVEASCPDHYCMRRGYCNSGSQIVCLPNRLVIRFINGGNLDGVAG
jgi:hypothetical protein